MFNHIAQALARGYIDLYYVNTETDEFVGFHTDDQHGVLTEARRGKDFFESCVREAGIYIHQEDQESFIRAMDRKTLMEALEGNDRFELIFRRMADGKPLFVKMDITRMEDDRRFIVIAVSDIDELTATGNSARRMTMSTALRRQRTERISSGPSVKQDVSLTIRTIWTAFLQLLPKRIS